jgi:hypothetical protein
VTEQQLARTAKQPTAFRPPSATSATTAGRLCSAARPAHLSQLGEKTAIQFAGDVLERLPFRVEVIQTDTGAQLQSLFHCQLLDRGGLTPYERLKQHAQARMQATAISRTARGAAPRASC